VTGSNGTAGTAAFEFVAACRGEDVKSGAKD
jgi:hypothetical protein